MAEPARCPHCGAELPPNSPEGLCVKCLYRAALQDQADRHLHIRCPHCHHPVEIVDDSPLTELTCPSCDTHFSLVGDQTISYAPEASNTIGHFELIDRIGMGAFGTVWKARDRELDRSVAIKIPRKGQLSAAETEQFLREARAAAQLQHPNIVSVHEIGRDEDTIYIVSDFVEGVSLADWLTGQQLTPREAAELCATIAEALHHAHENGVVHRDLKPSNIMLRGDLEPHIMDFGLAKREAGEITMTVEGKVLGTPAYMSPEQAKGEAHAADRRSDIYSLGIILFELLTGEQPFRGSMRMLLHQVINDEPPSPRKLNGSVPRDLETVCLKCLEKDPHKRYPTALELAKELRRWLGGEPIHARPVTRRERVWRWCKRNPVVSSLAAGLAVALAVGFIGVTSQWIRAEKQWIRAEKETERSTQQEQMTRRYLYSAHMHLAHQAWEADNVGRVLDLLNQHLPKPGQDDLRSFDWYYLWRLCHRDSMTVPFDQYGVATVVFSPDGALFASVGYRQETIISRSDPRPRMPANARLNSLSSTAGSSGSESYKMVFSVLELTVWDVETRAKRATFDVPPDRDDIRSLAISADGKAIACVSNFVVHKTANGSGSRRSPCVILFDCSTGKVATTLEMNDPMDEVQALAFSPDGQTLATAVSASEEGKSTLEVKLWDVATGKEQRTLERYREPGPIDGLAFSPDGKTLARLGWVRENRRPFWGVRVWNLSTGEEAVPLAVEYGGGGRKAGGLVFSPDGRTLATWNTDSIQLWELSTGKLQVSFTVQYPVQAVGFSSDSTKVAAGSGTTVRVWDVTTGDDIAALKGHTGSISSVAFGSDGDTVVSASARDGMIKLWDVAAYEEPVMIERDDLRAVASAPDNKTLASATTHGRIKLWDASTGKEMRTLQQPPKTAIGLINFPVAFAPDGQTLASPAEPGWETNPNSNRPAYRQRIRLWDISTGKVRTTLAGHTDHINFLAFSPDGKTLASGGGGENIKLWDLSAGEARIMPEDGKNWYPYVGRSIGNYYGASGAAFSPDGGRLASVSYQIVVWEVATGQALAAFQPRTTREPAGSPCIAFSPDGNLMATIHVDNTVMLWDVTPAKLRRIRDELNARRDTSDTPSRDMPPGVLRATLKGHANRVLSVAFCPDGKTVASAGADQLIKIWDVGTGEERLTLNGHRNQINSITFTPDGKTLVSGSQDGTIKLWRAAGANDVPIREE